MTRGGIGVVPGQGPDAEGRHEPDGEEITDPRLDRAGAVDRGNAALPFDGTPDVVGWLRWPAPKQAHSRPSFRSRTTVGATVPDSRRSPPPVKPWLTMQPVRLP